MEILEVVILAVEILEVVTFKFWKLLATEESIYKYYIKHFLLTDVCDRYMPFDKLRDIK